jgi:hypothetical protein
MCLMPLLVSCTCLIYSNLLLSLIRENLFLTGKQPLVVGLCVYVYEL